MITDAELVIPGGSTRIGYQMTLKLQANIPGNGFAEILVSNGSILRVTRLGDEEPEAISISPGLIDLQLNGFNGVDFSDANA